jgi:hypothetical protein
MLILSGNKQVALMHEMEEEQEKESDIFNGAVCNSVYAMRRRVVNEY